MFSTPCSFFRLISPYFLLLLLWNNSNFKFDLRTFLFNFYKFPPPMFYSFFTLLRFSFWFDPLWLYHAHWSFLLCFCFCFLSNTASSLFLRQYFSPFMPLFPVICLISPPTVLFGKKSAHSFICPLKNLQKHKFSSKPSQKKSSKT